LCACQVDLEAIFQQYGIGQVEMKASQYYQFAWDAQLIDDQSDVNAFFLMAVGAPYKGDLEIAWESFEGSLTKILESVAMQRDLDLVRACDILIRDHITPVADPNTMVPMLQAVIPEVIPPPPVEYAHPAPYPAYGYGHPAPYPAYGYGAQCPAYGYGPHPGTAYAPHPGSYRFMNPQQQYW
jgi:hypothetical protein